MRRLSTYKRSYCSGFTLVEILVVVAVMAIMAATLMPVFVRAKENAKLARCMSHLKEIGQACIMYLSDNEETFPVAFAYKDPGKYQMRAWPMGQAVGGHTSGVKIRDKTLPDEFRRPLWKYTKHSNDIWNCPSSPKLWVPGLGEVTDYQWYGNCYPMNLVFGAPHWLKGPQGSETLMYTLAGTERWPYKWSVGRKLSTVTRPSRIIMFGERGIHQYFLAGKEDPLFARKFRNHDQSACRMPVCFVDGHVANVLITGDHEKTINGKTYRTYGLWDKDWALLESGWIQEHPELGLPPGV